MTQTEPDPNLNPYKAKGVPPEENLSLGSVEGHFLPGLYWTWALLGVLILETVWIGIQIIPAYTEQDSLLSFARVIFANNAADVITGYNEVQEPISRLINIARLIVVAGWFYRAHKNLDVLGIQNLEYSHGWAAGAFFVPIMNMFRPFQIAREIWNGSDPRHAHDWASAWKKAPWPRAIILWWVLALGGGLIRLAPLLLSWGGVASASQQQTMSSILWVVAEVVEIGMLVYIVREIRAMQTARVTRVSRAIQHGDLSDYEPPKSPYGDGI